LKKIGIRKGIGHQDDSFGPFYLHRPGSIPSYSRIFLCTADWADFLPGRGCFSGPAKGKNVSIRPGIFSAGTHILCGMLLYYFGQFLLAFSVGAVK